ncbi:MAG: hypothetical protein LCI03_16535 [Actinobacteria bacterium]|nr:hypothetical protein [Actinomycetota bacterium]
MTDVRLEPMTREQYDAYRLTADEEYALFLRYTGLSEEHLVRRRLEAEPLGEGEQVGVARLVPGCGALRAREADLQANPARFGGGGVRR